MPQCPLPQAIRDFINLSIIFCCYKIILYIKNKICKQQQIYNEQEWSYIFYLIFLTKISKINNYISVL